MTSNKFALMDGDVSRPRPATRKAMGPPQLGSRLTSNDGGRRAEPTASILSNRAHLAAAPPPPSRTRACSFTRS